MKITKDTLNLIDPKQKDKYSVNMMKWLKKRMRIIEVTDTAFFHIPNSIWREMYLGYNDGGFIIGSQVGRILNGSKQTAAYAMGRMTFERIEFEEYIRIGRCLFDPMHTVSFLDADNRWEVKKNGKERSCRWCGNCKQRLVTRVVRETVNTWKEAR